jgi:hypothetical protein
MSKGTSAIRATSKVPGWSEPSSQKTRVYEGRGQKEQNVGEPRRPRKTFDPGYEAVYPAARVRSCLAAKPTGRISPNRFLTHVVAPMNI